jgi:hypothetical protein
LLLGRVALLYVLWQVILNGDKEARYSGNLNLSFAYVEVSSSIYFVLYKIACVRHTQPLPE